MTKYKIRVENNYHGKQAIMLEIYDEEYNCYSMMKAYPTENFSKNDKLAQMMLNNLHSILADTNGEVRVEVKDVEE